jgi:hypothetical protein
VDEQAALRNIRAARAGNRAVANSVRRAYYGATLELKAAGYGTERFEMARKFLEEALRGQARAS